jgi:hypothetical protein
VDRSEWDDNDEYPVAPSPAHERGWRHPSEIGAEAWVQSEPPLTIGRGLTAATGAVGGLLALAVLWTMLPTHAGRAGVSVLSSAPAPSAGLSHQFGAVADTDLTGPHTSSTSLSTAPSTSPITAEVSRDTKGIVASSVAHNSRPPIPTYQVAARTLLDRAVVAVAVNGGTLVITTARAVEADATVDLLGSDGGVEHARVLLTDLRSGFAVLAPGAAHAVSSFKVATAVAAGETLTFYGEPSHQVTVADDGSIAATWADDPSMPEGTPLVNEAGELVALCSHDAAGPHLIMLSSLDELERTLAGNIPAKVWLGVVLNNDPSGDATVAAVDPVGPAAKAGLRVGDTIDAVDSLRLGADMSLSAALTGRLPGDTVKLTVRRRATTITVVVVLGEPKKSL